MNDVDQLVESVVAALDRGDDASAILDAAPPAISAEAYDRAQRQAYRDRKDLARMRAITRAGLRHVTALADAADEVATSDALLGRVKVLAYNLPSFTWPGWDEPGITPTPDDLADGRDAARLNLRLAIRLARPDRVLADAHWLIGAHALAAGDFAAASASFAEAREFAATAGEGDRAAMLDGYLALAESLADPSTIGRFDAAIAKLRDSGEPGAVAYADQLATAHRVLARAIRK